MVRLYVSREITQKKYRKNNPCVIIERINTPRSAACLRPFIYIDYSITLERANIERFL
jgi:hypothetical protein